MNKQLAVIKSASLDFYNGSVLTFRLDAEYETGGGQIIGGYALDNCTAHKGRIGTAYGCEMIRQLLLFFGVSDFAKVKDHVCYVVGEGDGLSFTPKGLDNLSLSTTKHCQSILRFDDVMAAVKQ